jgi:hypothetical protein
MRLYLDVGIYEEEPIGLDGRGGGCQRVAFAEPAGGEVADVEDLEFGVRNPRRAGG